MNTQTEAQYESKPIEYAVHSKLELAYFNRSVGLCGEIESAAVWPAGKSGHRPGNTVDVIAPAWLGPAGEVLEKGNGAPHGLVLKKRHHDLHTGRRAVLQCFVPWANVRCLSYGE